MSADIVLVDKRGIDVTNERAVTTSCTSAQPGEWLLEALGAGGTAAGIQITRELAMTIDTVWKGAGLISTDMAKRNLNLYQVKDGVKRLATEHPSYWLMRHKPSRWQRAFDYRQQLTLHKLLYGASYAFNVLDGRGRVVQSLPLLPDSVSIEHTREGRIFSFPLYYSDGTFDLYKADESQIRHETWISYDGVNGYGVLKTAKELLGRIIAMRTYGTNVFKNAARPATVIKMATEIKDEAKRQAFIASWERMYAGVDNAHRTAIMPVGAEIQTLSNTAKDAQFNEQEERSVKQVANHFLMPGSKLNSAIAAGYKSLEQDDLQYQNDCLHGHQVSFEDCCNHTFLTEEEIRDGYFFEFDQARYRTADLASLGEFFSKALGNNTAWMAPNQIRAVFGDNPLPGGDDLPVNTATAPAQPATEDPETPDAEESTDLEDSLRAVMRDSIQRASTRLVEKAKRAFKDGGAVAALAAIDCEKCERIAEIIGPSARAFEAVTGKRSEYPRLLTVELSRAVRDAAANGPDAFANSLSELTADLPERLVA